MTVPCGPKHVGILSVALGEGGGQIYKEQVFVFCWLRVVGVTTGLGRDALCSTFCSLMKSYAESSKMYLGVQAKWHVQRSKFSRCQSLAHVYCTEFDGNR